MAGARYTHERYDNVKKAWFVDFSCQLILDRSGDMRLTRGNASLKRTERAINLTVTVPQALFEAPSLRAKIVVDSADTKVDIDVAAASDALREALGVDIDLKVNSDAG